MENTPSLPTYEAPATEKDEKNKDKDKSDKDKAGSLGSLVFKPEATKAEADKPTSLFDFLKADAKLASSATRSPDVEQQPDKELPLDELSPAEQVEVVRTLARARAEALPAEQPTNPADQASETAAANFIEQASVSGDSQAALEAAAAELGLDIGVAAAETEEQTKGSNDAEAIIDPQQAGAEGMLNLRAAAEQTDEDDPSSTVPTPAGSSQSTGPASSGPAPGGRAGAGRGSGPNGPGGNNGSGGAAAGGSGGQPPYGGPPRAPGAGNASNLGSPNGPSSPNLPTNPNVSIPNPNIARRLRQAEADGLLLGAIVGYLYGRRRGRKKTEKRLLPVQRKLEKQVSSLQEKLADNEWTIRQAAVRRYQQTGQALVAPTLKAQLHASEQRSLHTAPERSRHLAPLLPPERIGHVLVAAEATGLARRATAEKIDKPKAENLQPTKQAETMTRAELLGLSERISIDGSTLRQIYENNLVTEKGLRRLIAEHLRGGNIKKALRRELVEREIDFERDPQLRDRARSSVTGGGKSALDSLLKQAGALPINDDDSSDKAVPTKKSRAAKNSQKNPSTLVDSAFITVIVVLALLVLALLFR